MLETLTLDLHTLGLILILLSAPLALILALTNFNTLYTGGVGTWAMGKFFFGMALGLSLLRGAIPLLLSNWLASILGAVGMGMLALGVLTYKKEKAPWTLFLIYIVIVVILSSVNYFAFVNQSGPAILKLSSAILVVLPGFYAARLLLIRMEQPLRIPYWITGCMFILLNTSLLARVALSPLIVGPSAPELHLINQLSIGVLCLSFLVISYSFLMMIHYRIAMDLERLASVDSLTGALNRRSLGEQAAKLAKRRGPNVVGIIMLDIDLFKGVNDQYGHQAGDKVLQHLSTSAQSVLRGLDYFARVGGEEFCALLTDSDENMTTTVAERIREACVKSRVTYRGQKIRYTVSAGVSSGDTTNTTFEKLIGEADQALYLAKNTGRNRVIRWSQVHDMVDTETFAKSQIPDPHYSFTASNFRSPDDPQY